MVVGIYRSYFPGPLQTKFRFLIAIVPLAMIPLTLKQIDVWETSRSLFQHTLSSQPDGNKIRLGLIATLDRERQSTLVLHHLALAIQNEPESADVLKVAAIVHRGLGNLEAELMYLRRSLYWNVNQPELMTRLAYLLAAHPDKSIRRPEEALQLAKQAYSLTAEKGSENAGTYLETWAIAEASCGNFSQAASLCERSVEASTPATPVGVQRQRQLFQAGQPYIDFQLPQRKSQRLELTPQ